MDLFPSSNVKVSTQLNDKSNTSLNHCTTKWVI